MMVGAREIPEGIPVAIERLKEARLCGIASSHPGRRIPLSVTDDLRDPRVVTMRP
jgi:hypothetical protein